MLALARSAGVHTITAASQMGSRPGVFTKSDPPVADGSRAVQMKKNDVVIPVEEEESSSDGEGLVTLKGSSNFLSIATHLGRSLKFPQSWSLRSVHRPEAVGIV